MRVLTFLNEKGGVGKTTLATNTAVGLALRGMRVVLIDVDPQGHSTTSFGLKKTGGVYNLIAQEASWSEVIVPPLEKHWRGDYANVGELLVLPGDIQTQAIPVVCDPTGILRERLDELDGWADVVVIDTPPTPSALQTMVYLATTDLIYPSQAQALSLDGLAESVKRLQGLNKTRLLMGVEAVNLLGVVPTMVKPNTTAHQHGLKLIAKHFGEALTLPAITERTVWRDREYAKQPIFAYAPESEAAYEMWALIDAIGAKMAVAHG